MGSPEMEILLFLIGNISCVNPMFNARSHGDGNRK